MEESRVIQLLNKYRDGKITEYERAELESWYLTIASSNSLQIDSEEVETILKSMRLSVSGRRRQILSLWQRAAIAASLLIVVASGALYYYKNTHHDSIALVAVSDIPGGTNRALLELADGRRIELDKIQPGTFAKEGSTVISKSSEGEIIYTSNAEIETDKNIAFNTVSTPKAGQYKIQLPDGSRVWLNALSSIRFPASFTNQERMVQISGEAYFEVVKKMKAGRRVAFKVVSKGQTIDVLGTRFNVNTYSDERTSATTLIEGSVQLTANRVSKPVRLVPGQQARLANTNTPTSPNNKIKVETVNIGEVTAWKDGYFQFDGVGLEEVLRQVSRWYDVEVQYDVPVSNFEFVGRFERKMKLSQVLKILEIGGVRFQVNGKKVIVRD